jgi:hypothetical protein
MVAQAVMLALEFGMRIDRRMDTAHLFGGGFAVAVLWSIPLRVQAMLKVPRLMLIGLLSTAALLARRGMVGVGKVLSKPVGSALPNFSRKDLPFKVAERIPGAHAFNVITSSWTFADAYNHRLGTHVIQTHGSSADVEQQARGIAGSPSGNATAARVGAGFLLGGAAGAAVGAATSGSKHSRWYELPTPIVTPKRGVTDMLDGHPYPSTADTP